MTVKQKKALAEAVKALRETPDDDQESAHAKADDALLKFVADAGFPLVADEWHAALHRCGGFWYS